MKRNRALIDVVTGITLCGIFVGAGYAILSPQYTSLSTPPAKAVCPNDCAAMTATVATAGQACGSVSCQMDSGTLGCWSSTALVICAQGFMCDGSPTGTCVNPCEQPGFSEYPYCDGAWVASAGHGESCQFQCKTLGIHMCSITPFPLTCSEPGDYCDPGSHTCINPCDAFPDVPLCEGSSVQTNIAEGGQCVFECKTVNGMTCNATSVPGGCNQTEKPLQCDPGTRKCVDPCAGFPGGLCRDIDLTTPVGEGEFCMLTCNEYNGTTCNSNGSRTVPCNSPDLTCNPTSRTCEPMCNGMPGACSSSSSSSAAQCCNLDTGMCQDI